MLFGFFKLVFPFNPMSPTEDRLALAFSKRYWEIADHVKRRLFNKLRESTQSINYLDYDGYTRSFDAIYDSLLEEWGRTREQFKDDHDFEAKRLEGYLLEALFYYSCLKRQAFFMDYEIVKMGEEEKSDEYPPWFEATPLYDIIPTLHHVKEMSIRKRRAPQTKADFIVTYASASGPAPPSQVDVKGRKPRTWRTEWGWQVTAALRRGFTFQLAYPRNGVRYPKELEDWETATPCSNCKKLSTDPRKCSECGKEVFPFTIADAYYEANELWKKIGKDRQGRF